MVCSSFRIQEVLSGILKAITEKVKLSGVIIIGGDTAVNICRKFDVKGLKIIGEVEPFVPAGLMLGFAECDLPVVTKAGGFGSEDVIINAARYLSGEKHYV